MSSWGWFVVVGEGEQVLERRMVVVRRRVVGESSEGQCEGGLERGVWRRTGVVWSYVGEPSAAVLNRGRLSHKTMRASRESRDVGGLRCGMFGFGKAFRFRGFVWMCAFFARQNLEMR